MSLNFAWLIRFYQLIKALLALGLYYLTVMDELNSLIKRSFPNNGWVEHDPDDIWHTVESTCKNVIAVIDNNTDTIKAIGLTNQRETKLIWVHKTGMPIYRAIVWQNRCSSDYCQQLKSNNIETLISEKLAC